jgi:hypothetical protein
MVSISDLYGWTARSDAGGWSAAKAYGWTPREPHPAFTRTCHCTRCGAEIPIQRAGSLYECEHCTNTRDD